MSPENETSSLFSWQRLRSREEIVDFINRRLAALEFVTLED
jgi:hypothetical protein